MLRKFENENPEEKIAQDIQTVEANLGEITNPEAREATKSLLEWSKYILEIINLDPFTGLYSRRILPRIRSFDAAVMIDMDDFKSVNDRFGHQVGDIIIQKMAKIIMNNTRANDYPCHIGGDEFLIIFTHCDIEIVKARVEKILAQLSSTIELPDFVTTTSAGIAANDGTRTLEELIKLADDALYVSKAKGKNCITVHQDKIIRPNENV